MISYTKYGQEENKFFLPFNVKHPIEEENNLLVSDDFPLYKSFNPISINLDNFYNNSFYDNFKPIYGKGKELQKKNKNNSLFLIIKETPPVLLKKDISYFLRNKMNLSKKIKDILDNKYYLKNNAIENIMKQLINNESTKNKKLNKEIDNANKKKLGRKTINDETIRIHNKYSSDNIINKIKTILKKHIIIFVNNIIKSLYTSKQIKSILLELDFPINKVSELIKDVDYKSIAHKKKKMENLMLLTYTLKDFLSFDLSGRYKAITQKKGQFSKNNQKIMKEYLLKDDKNNAIFNFVLNNLKFEDFLDLFIHTKELSDFPSFNSLNGSEKKIIEKCLVRIESYLKKLYKEKDYVYFICFLLLIYNYRRYFSIKAERNGKKAEISEIY